jgi:hypothetical protein
LTVGEVGCCFVFQLSETVHPVTIIMLLDESPN